MNWYRECSGVVLRRLAEGESLREICSEGGMPSVSTVYGWLMPGSGKHKPEFLAKYRVARMWQAEALVERLLEVARDAGLSEARRKAEMEALKVAIGKLGAVKYGALEEASGELVVRVIYENDPVLEGGRD